mgnify:CR=1 FL=1
MKIDITTNRLMDKLKLLAPEDRGLPKIVEEVKEI